MPRAVGACAVLVLAVAAVGCFTPAGRRSEALRPPTPAGLPPALPDGLYVESVLLERPLGDPALDRELWEGGSAVPPHVRALLAENGLRVAVLGGTPPPAFRRLLESGADAHDGRGQSFANRKDEVVPTAGPTDPCSFAVLPTLAGERARFDLRKARGGVLVRPERAADGRVKVWCEPRVQHGERADEIRPTADGTGFTVQGVVPVERFPALGFEVTLGPDDYLLIGSPAAGADTLGSVLFTADAGGRPRQRVLAVRAAWRGEKPSDLPPVRGRGEPTRR
ncbi:MAG: hypothetical protein K2X87_28255 [Gemmataceae bacterium]|nr:hypothetical protein [Gemmataceae bacterium]